MKKFLAPMILGTSFFLSSQSFALTDVQKKELYEKGTITVYDQNGNKKGHYEIKFMPGTQEIKADALEGLTDAYKLMDDFVDRDGFWRDTVWENFKWGINYLKRLTYDEGVCAIPSDFRDTIANNKEVDDTFGANAAKLKNWVNFTGKCVERVGASVWGAAFGISYAVVAPTACIVLRPVVAGTKALIPGTLWPSLRFAWNGAAWGLVKGSDEPKSDSMFVTFVPEQITDSEVASLNTDTGATETRENEDL